MIDTQIWIYSKKKPIRTKFESETDYLKTMELHQKAEKFLKSFTGEVIIYFSIQQIGELFHTLAFRGVKIPVNEANEFINILINSDNIIVIPYSTDDLIKAMILSARSKIHIWDYLCVIPLINHISKIYTVDSHFKDKTFIDLGISIENPLEVWQTL